MSLGISILVTAAIAGALGLFIGWLVGSRKHANSPSDARLENELRQQVGQRETELIELRSKLTETGNARSAADAKLAATENMLVEQRALQDKALIDLREAFRALSAEALSKAQPEFLALAKQSFETLQANATGNLAQKEQAIKGLVEPLAQQLQAYQSRLQQSETAQSSTLGEVKKQLELLSQQSTTLANETQQFRLVLHSNQARGKWGEETLRRVVEAAGMSAHCDFIEQTSSGENRPDLVVKLPGNRVIVVDAKVPDFDFLNGLESAEPIKRAEALKAHAQKMKATIKALADRDYPAQFKKDGFEALDYVVLFMPAESLFSAALEGDRDLIVEAAKKRILLATPASLIALLRSVSLSWEQHKQTENAQEIAEATQEFYARIIPFVKHFVDMRKAIEQTNSCFNKAIGSYEHEVRPQGEKLVKLGGLSSSKELPEIKPLETTLRLPQR